MREEWSHKVTKAQRENMNYGREELRFNKIIL